MFSELKNMDGVRFRVSKKLHSISLFFPDGDNIIVLPDEIRRLINADCGVKA